MYNRFIPCVWNIFTAGLLEVSVVKVSLYMLGKTSSKGEAAP